MQVDFLRDLFEHHHTEMITRHNRRQGEFPHRRLSPFQKMIRVDPYHSDSSYSGAKKNTTEYTEAGSTDFPAKKTESTYFPTCKYRICRYFSPCFFGQEIEK